MTGNAALPVTINQCTFEMRWQCRDVHGHGRRCVRSGFDHHDDDDRNPGTGGTGVHDNRQVDSPAVAGAVGAGGSTGTASGAGGPTVPGHSDGSPNWIRRRLSLDEPGPRVRGQHRARGGLTTSGHSLRRASVVSLRRHLAASAKYETSPPLGERISRDSLWQPSSARLLAGVGCGTSPPPGRPGPNRPCPPLGPQRRACACRHDADRPPPCSGRASVPIAVRIPATASLMAHELAATRDRSRCRRVKVPGWFSPGPLPGAGGSAVILGTWIYQGPGVFQ